MSPYDRAQRAVDALAPEDALLLTQTLVARQPYGTWRSLFTLCEADVDVLVLRLWVESAPADRAGMLWGLLGRVFDYLDIAEVQRMEQWLDACLRPRA